MSTVVAYKQLLEAVVIDQKLILLDQNIKSFNDQITFLNAQKNTAFVTEKKLESERFEVKKQVDFIELKINELDQEESQKKALLEKAVSTKEIKSIEKELSTLSTIREDLENQLVSFWHNLEGVEKKIKEIGPKSKEQEEELNKKIIDIQESIKKIEIEKEEFDKKRVEILDKVNPELLSKYSQMRGKSINPIVPVLNKGCSGCYYAISATDLARIKSGEIVHCKNCFRLLYIEEQAQEPVY